MQNSPDLFGTLEFRGEFVMFSFQGEFAYKTSLKKTMKNSLDVFRKHILNVRKQKHHNLLGRVCLLWSGRLVLYSHFTAM